MTKRTTKRATKRAQLKGEYAAAGALLDKAPFVAVKDHPAFEALLKIAVAACEAHDDLTAEDAAVLAVAVQDMLAMLRPHAAGTMSDETLQKLLGAMLVYTLERRRIGSADPAGVVEATRAAWHFRPRAYRLSPASDAEADLRGRVTIGPDQLSRRIGNEFLELMDDTVRLGRPKGLDWSAAEWESRVADGHKRLRELGLKRTDTALATEMRLAPTTFKSYKKYYGLKLPT